MSLGLGVGLASASSLIGDSALVLRNWSPDDIDTYLWLDGSDASTQTKVSNANSYMKILEAHNSVDEGEIILISFQDSSTVNGDTPTGTIAFDPADQGIKWDYVNPQEISRWNDKSGRANHMLASGDPPTTLATLNGLSVLDFKESGGYMSNTTQSLPAGKQSWFAVFRPDAPLGNLGGAQFGTSSMMSYGTFGNNTWQVQGNSKNGFSGKINFGSSASGDPSINPSGGSALGNYAIWGWSFNANLISTRFNGTQTNTDHSDNSHSAPVANQRIGLMSNRSLSTYLDGRMAEVICIDNDTLINQQIAEGYLAHKWDLANLLPNTHPFKDTRPMVQDGVINFLVDEDGNNILDQTGNPIVV